MELQSALVLELADAALQAVEPISQRTAAWQSFARCAVPQLGLGSLARLEVLLQQYGPEEDAELALLLWQGEIASPAFVIKAVQRLRSLVAFLQGQGITNAASWLQWRDTADAQAVLQGTQHLPTGTINALLWHLDSGRCDVPWVLMFARRVLGQAPAHGHIMLAVQEMAEAMDLSAKTLARRIAWHERLFQALGDVPELRLVWWRCAKRTLQSQLTNATLAKLQVQGMTEPVPLSLAMHLRQGQPMLMIQLPRAFGAAPAWPNLTMVQLRQEGWRSGLRLRLLLQGEGVLPAHMQLDIAKRWKAEQLQPPVFERISAIQWEVSCCWCDGLWKPSSLDQVEVMAWATDTALQVMEYVQLLKGMLTEFQARKKVHRGIPWR
ncbi:hypothetical protein [Comamonas sp. C11]|uniref:hypothetical protein n=1 Tax=Comamonas sp. C11 TaxID=2966554 RepID=UPI0021111F29|nr:hypothetical protein [Comamonas sp. C11]UUC92729.1 hypothetical protein NOX35_21015 [Comamonas sp. C11]